MISCVLAAEHFKAVTPLKVLKVKAEKMSDRKGFILHPGPHQLHVSAGRGSAPLVSRFVLMDVTRWLTLNASTPAWMTGAKTVSLSLESANMSGIWSRRLQRRGARHGSAFSLTHSVLPHVHKQVLTW